MIHTIDLHDFRCFLSLVCRDNPAMTVGHVLRDAPDLIPITDHAFDPIRQVVQEI